MSQPSEHRTEITTQDESVSRTEKTGAATHLNESSVGGQATPPGATGNNTSAREYGAEVEVEGGADHAPSSDVAARPGNQDGDLIATKTVSATQPLEPVRSSRADDIEKEASEHLARRAAELTTAYDDRDASSSSALAALGPSNGHGEPQTLPFVSPTTLAKSNELSSEPQTQVQGGENAAHLDGTTGHWSQTNSTSPDPAGAEIQTIMEQFESDVGGSEEQAVMSPRSDAQPFTLPPRTSSLENRDQLAMSPQTTGGSNSSHAFTQRGQDPTQSISRTSTKDLRSDDTESIRSARVGSIFQPPPPSPDPEPVLPFDFHRFLEQLRHRTADSVARFLRSFLQEFGKKQWMVHEQVKIVADFLEFISKKMSQCEVWRTVSEAEFNNAREGMEKLVMNRLYSQTFSPAIAPVLGSPRKSGKAGRSAADMANPQGPGRRGQHQEDVERDEVIAQKLRIYGWINEDHLDIQPINEKGRKFLNLAQQELLKINTYRAPRDKVVCVLNSCKVIFGYLRNTKADTSADAFIPLLIYTVLRAKPEHLASNVQYIGRFRNQDKLTGEAGYYMSSLMGVVSFIENLDRTNLTITDEEFEINVEQAVSAIAEKDKTEEYEAKTNASTMATPMQQRLNEKSELSRPEVTPRHSMDAEQSSPRKSGYREKPSHSQQQSSSDSGDDLDAVTGLLRTIKKPLNSIGRIFADEEPRPRQQRDSSSRPPSTPIPSTTPRGPSPALLGGTAKGEKIVPPSESRVSGTDVAARQASADAGQAKRVRIEEHKVVVEYVLSVDVGCLTALTIYQDPPKHVSKPRYGCHRRCSESARRQRWTSSRCLLGTERLNV